MSHILCLYTVSKISTIYLHILHKINLFTFKHMYLNSCFVSICHMLIKIFISYHYPSPIEIKSLLDKTSVSLSVSTHITKKVKLIDKIYEGVEFFPQLRNFRRFCRNYVRLWHSFRTFPCCQTSIFASSANIKHKIM